MLYALCLLTQCADFDRFALLALQTVYVHGSYAYGILSVGLECISGEGGRFGATDFFVC